MVIHDDDPRYRLHTLPPDVFRTTLRVTTPKPYIMMRICRVKPKYLVTTVGFTV